MSTKNKKFQRYASYRPLICPPMAIYVQNCYKKSSRLFVLGGKEIKPDEGTTQGDPMAMPIYAIGILPLLDMIKDDTSRSVKHVAFADDLQCWSEIIEKNAKNGVVLEATSNLKLFLREHMVKLKIISLYIYKDLRLKSNESRDHYHEDGNLVPSPRSGFSFEAAFQL